jgi:hypothetical protein
MNGTEAFWPSPQTMTIWHKYFQPQLHPLLLCFTQRKMA